MSDGPYVVDASAVLAVIFRESGQENIRPILDGARISAVNLSEVVARLIDRGSTDEDIDWALADMHLKIVPFDGDQAMATAKLRAPTRAKGLSLGDRACLALAAAEQATVMTTDRAWATLDLPIPIKLAR
ncbi:MAG: type II toxin-antitoxin system VapC family toxin [Pseudomonadota bacterium]